jgi:serine kinase of HPr protein (carbohydrate metabolism regulator)
MTEQPPMQCVADCVSFAVPFRLLADDETVLEQMLNVAPLESIRVTNGLGTSEQFRLRSPTDTSGYIGYIGCIGDEVTIEHTNLQPVLEQLQRDLMVHVANQAPDRVFVHAGVVGWRGRALVFPGRSFAGKTTLVTELVKAGATYYSDEYAVVDADGRVHPYARDLQMREPGKTEQRSVAVEQLGGVSGTVAIPVAQVLFAEYREYSTWLPEPISAGRAVLEMLQHSIPVQRTPARAMATLSGMMKDATAWRSQRGEARDTARIILAAMAQDMKHA